MIEHIPARLCGIVPALCRSGQRPIFRSQLRFEPRADLRNCRLVDFSGVLRLRNEGMKAAANSSRIRIRRVCRGMPVIIAITVAGTIAGWQRSCSCSIVE